ncbi:MAG: FeoA family protein [Ignavibacteriaceae bacterium]
MNQTTSMNSMSQTYPLSFLNEGEQAEIVELRKFSNTVSNQNNSLLRLDEMGIRSGRIVEMLNNSNSNSVLIKVDNSRLALSRKIAMKIFVRRSE